MACASFPSKRALTGYCAARFFSLEELLLPRLWLVPAADLLFFAIEAAGWLRLLVPAWLAAVVCAPPVALEAVDLSLPVEDLRWWLVRRNGVGSATRTWVPAATRVPEGIPFQRRNSLSETPKRSAMVIRVSPRRAV